MLNISLLTYIFNQQTMSQPDELTEKEQPTKSKIQQITEPSEYNLNTLDPIHPQEDPQNPP